MPSLFFNKIFSFSQEKILCGEYSREKRFAGRMYNEKERHRKSEDFRSRSLTGVSHGNQTIDTAFSIGVLSAIGYVIIVVCGN